MKKKVFSLMMMLLLAFMGVAKAEVVTIGDGTGTTYYGPFNSLWGYSFVEQIYTADEIGTAGTITSISFNMSSTSEETNSVDVFMKNVSRTEFSNNTDWEPVTASDMVFSGTVTFSPGWTTITLDTPFEYDGFSNLMIGMHEYTSGYSTRYFYYTSVTNALISAHSDTADPNPYDIDSFTGTKYVQNYRVNLQMDIIPGGGGQMGDRLHVKYLAGEEEIIDSLNLGTRPIGAWMEPFEFVMYSEGPTYTVNVLDFTPTDGLFSVGGVEVPFQVNRLNDVNMTMAVNGTEAGLIERQFVAITEGDRAAHVWPVVVELYDPQTPDVWEKACTQATTFPFVEVPATAHNIALHNDYTLPFPEIPEGYDAVYKLVFDQDQVLDAEVTAGANGKVALYTEDFYGEAGPMAHNNYTGIQMGGTAGAAFEAMIGDETSTTTSTYFPFHTLWNYSIGENLFLASELTEAGVTTAPMTSLSWYVTSLTTTTPQNGISIWMANVSDAELTATSHITNGMTLVYTGNDVLPVAGEWNEFEFNEGNFAWDGHSNVLIVCQRLNGDWQGSISWQTHNPGFTAMSYDYDDYEVYDMTNQTYSMYTSATNRANIILKSNGGRTVTREDVVVNFEDQQIPADWNNDATYPWVVVSENGSYVMKSSNGGNASTTSTISATYELNNDGSISFDALCMGEGSSTIWDKCIFSIDGQQQFSYGANVPGWNNYSYELTAGSHTFTWTYSKDGSVNPTGDYFMVDNVTVTGMDEPLPEPELNYSFGPVIEDLPLRSGTYYLVASSTDPDFEVTINAEVMPCPEVDGFAFNPTPADNADGIEPGSVTLRWNIPTNTTGWRLIFGTTYHPEPGHPQTIMYPEDGTFSTSLANSYTVRNLWNNNNYFWRVEFINDGCPEGVSSPVWGFTTHLNIPQNLTAVDYTVFDDETVVLNWNAVVDRTYRMYNVYRDGQLIGNTQVNDIANSTYTDGPLTYNVDGYTYYVTAVYDEGESAPSDPVTVKVSGYGNVDGHVYEQDGTTGIAGATVTMTGLDEFGVNHTYNFTTNAQGYYSGHIYAGSYEGQAAKEGYQTITQPVQGNPIAMVYNQTTSPIDYILDENFNPVCSVLAEYYPDPEDINAPYVKVSWGCGLPGEEIVEPFETGDFSLFDWQVDATYPWTVTTTNPYEGQYCMVSGGAGVANVVSNMAVTVDIPADGDMSFFGKISCESNWDYGYFYIDGVQKASFTGAGNWIEKTYAITEGTHTFQWSYTKDGSVNSNDDCFYVDYITFYRRPEPPIPGMTYDFEDSSMQGWTSVDADGDGHGWMLASELMSGATGNNGSADFVFSQSYDNSVGVLYPDNYLVSPQVQLGGIVRFYACAQDANYAAEHFGLAVSTTNTDPSSFTMLQEWTMSAKGGASNGKPVKDSRSGREQGNWYEYTVDLSAYSGMGYVAIRHFNCSDMFYLDVDDITIGEPGKGLPSDTRTLSHYRIYRTDCYNDGPYTEDNTILLATNWPGDTIYIDVSWPDAAPGVYKWGVGTVYAGNRGEMIESPISWTEPMQVGGTRETLSCDFEGGMPAGWTVIDANNDGLTWTMTSEIPSTWTYYASLDLDWYHGGSNAICSGSYINGYGAVTPDEYFVSPQVTLAAGSSIDFWVAATDGSYPADHFGVFVSDNGTSNWTSVQEWTLTAKKSGLMGGAASRNGEGLRLGTWYNYTVDLSAYAGQKYIAFRHFNCYDQYIMCLDDITINTAGGSVPPTPPTPPTPGQGGTQLVDFEGGEIPANFDNTVSNYPWIIWNNNPYSGTYCMASNNYHVASSESYLDATVEFAADGSIDFYSRISSESVNYDYGIFYIDGVEQYREGGTSNWTNRHFNVSAGTHTFRWYYRKDSSVNSGEDRYFIDEITFEGVPGGNGNNLNWLALPRESETIWSNCLDKDMWIDIVDVTVLLNSADSPEGVMVTLTNLNEYEQAAYPVAPVTLDETGFYAWDHFRKGEYSVKVEFDGYEPIADTVSIWDETHLRYVMTEILYGIGNVYVSRTGWAMWDGAEIPGGGGGQGGNGDTFSEDFDAGMPAGWTTVDADGDGYTWVSSMTPGNYHNPGVDLTGTGHNASAHYVISGSYANGTGAVLYPDNYLVSPQVNLVNGSTFSFWACAQDANYAAEHFGVAVSDNGVNDWTMVQEWTLTAKGNSNVASYGRDGNNRVQGNWYNYTVDLSAYAGQKYIAIRHFNCHDEFILNVDDIQLTAGAKDGGERHLEYYKVLCTSIDGVPIYNHNTVYPFCQLTTDGPYNAPLVEGEHYLCKVAAVYSTGVSPWSEPVEWEYEPCDHWGPVDEVTVNTTSEGNHIEWVFEHGYNPYGGETPTPPTPGENATVILTAGDVWGDGSGYQMLLDADATAFGSTIPETGALSTSCTGNEAIYAEFEYKIPTNADGNCSTQNMVMNNSVSIEIPAGTYDWCITNPTPGDRIWIAAANGNVGGRQNDYVFEAGKTYEFTVSMYGSNDGVDVIITGGAKNMYAPLPAGEVKDIANVTPIKGNTIVKGGEFYTQYAEDGAMLNFYALDNVDLRAYLLYTLSNDSRFSLVPEDEYGQFIITSDYMDEFETVYRDAIADFSMLSKVDIADRIAGWKNSVSPTNYLSIMMDVMLSKSRVDNDHCINSLPFCTSETITFEAASTSNTADEPGMDDGCIGSSYNPSFYHMRIHTGGSFVIHMEGHDPNNGTDRDIDFCMWGPYTEQEVVSGTACSNLTGNKIMDCCYSASYSEDCYLGYPEGQHQHNTSHGDINYHMPEVGEYYILMITNYSQQPCVINFTKTEGEGETDCEIVTPTDLIGFLITEDGEYVAFAGPDDREYTVEGEYGNHEYCVRPIYPGEMTLPDHNYGWSMGCPVCEFTNGESICEPGAPIHAEQVDGDHIKVWWGEQNPGPGGCEGDEFTLDFESGIPAGWTTIDADGDGYNWNLASSTMGTGYGHNGSSDMIFSQSYDNNTGALNPDNWLVSPAVTLCEGSTFSFYACAQDASWASEHFGVAVSDDNDQFVMVQEWTMTAKGVPYDGPRGMRAQGNWYQYTVDLGNYAGEGRYVAIRHFNCSDWFYLDVDDIQLTNGAKNRANIVKYNVYRSTDPTTGYTMIGEVAETGATYYEYIDEPGTAGVYYYQVRADYGDCESEPAQAADDPNHNYVAGTCDGLDENSDNVALFPNPTNGNVTIQAKAMSRITVVSVLGQVVYDTELKADEYTLNMGQFNAGMYMVRVYTENGVTVKRVTVMQ